jgi:hypothetical protein
LVFFLISEEAHRILIEKVSDRYQSS